MSIVIAFVAGLLRLAGYFTEPHLSPDDIHLVTGGQSAETERAEPSPLRRIVTWNIERGVQFDRIVEVLRGLDGDVGDTGPVIVGGDFNNHGDVGSAMFGGLRKAGFTNTRENRADAPRPRRDIDWIFVKGVRGSAAVVRADGASDHDPVVTMLIP